MNWQQEILLIGRAVLATVLGALVGWQREKHGREVGIRTYAAVSLGACAFGMVSNTTADQRIAAQVVTGVGFICAGVIMRHQMHVRGLTTAASLWAISSVGLAVAYGMYVLGIFVALLSFALLSLKHKLQMDEPPQDR